MPMSLVGEREREMLFAKIVCHFTAKVREEEKNAKKKFQVE